jgi:hypothetical protein
MAWVVTNPAIFTAFGGGTFEGGAGTAKAGIVDGMASYGLTNLEHHEGAQSYRCWLNNSASYTSGGTAAQRSLIRFLVGQPLINGRRYTVTGWFKIRSRGQSSNGDVIKLHSILNKDVFPVYGNIIGDLRLDFGILPDGWKQFTFQQIMSVDVDASKASLCFMWKWDTTQVQPLPGSQSVIMNTDVVFDQITIIEEENQVAPTYPNLAANAVGTDATIDGGSDGKIVTTVTAGSGQYEVTYLDTMAVINLNSGTNPQSVQRTGLPADDYFIKVKDTLSLQEMTLSVEIRDPDPEPIPETGTFLYVPMMNSLHFVRVETPNSCDVLQTHDNALFCKQIFQGFWCSNYYQKVQKCDVFPLQFQSNYPEHEIKLFNYRDDTEVWEYTAEMKEQNVGVASLYQITIRNHGLGQSRVYFSVGGIPLPLAVGDVFEVLNNLDGFNGSYAIASIQNDVLLGTQYLVINKNYIIAAANSNATGKFLSNTVNFNVYEFLVNNLGETADGEYYFKVKAIDNSKTDEFVSEPFLLKVKHDGTNLIEYRNFDNAFDMTYTTGIVCRIRVESTLFKRLPGGTREVIRNTDESLHKLAARKRRGFLIEFWLLPPYMHEKLSVIFDHDLIKINGVEYQTEEGLSDPKYITRYKLANSEIKIEQVYWFKNNNSDDLGNVNIETGFIIVNEGLLKR